MAQIDKSQLLQLEYKISEKLDSEINLDELESLYAELEQILYQRFLFNFGN